RTGTRILEMPPTLLELSERQQPRARFIRASGKALRSRRAWRNCSIAAWIFSWSSRTQPASLCARAESASSRSPGGMRGGVRHILRVRFAGKLAARGKTGKSRRIHVRAYHTSGSTGTDHQIVHGFAGPDHPAGRISATSWQDVSGLGAAGGCDAAGSPADAVAGAGR